MPNHGIIEATVINLHTETIKKKLKVIQWKGGNYVSRKIVATSTLTPTFYSCYLSKQQAWLMNKLIF